MHGVKARHEKRSAGRLLVCSSRYMYEASKNGELASALPQLYCCTAIFSRLGLFCCILLQKPFFVSCRLQTTSAQLTCLGLKLTLFVSPICTYLVPRYVTASIFSSSLLSQRITSGTIMYIGQCKEFHGQAVHKLAAALQEDIVAAPSGLIKVAVW